RAFHVTGVQTCALPISLPPGLFRRRDRPVKLETERLIIREWEPRDRDAYIDIVTDPEVRRFYFGVPTRAEAEAILDRFILFYERSEERRVGKEGSCRVT